LRGRRQLATGLRHGARVATAALADAAMLRQTKTRLAHPRIEPDIAHELLRRGETADLANRRDEACGHDDVDAGGLESGHRFTCVCILLSWNFSIGLVFQLIRRLFRRLFPMESADRFRKFAIECQVIAKSTSNPEKGQFRSAYPNGGCDVLRWSSDRVYSQNRIAMSISRVPNRALNAAPLHRRRSGSKSLQKSLFA